MVWPLIHNRYSKADRERAAQFETELCEIELAVAARFARGNLALQSECVLTEAQLEQEREEFRQKLAAAA